MTSSTIQQANAGPDEKGLHQMLGSLRGYFSTGATRSYAYRRQQLLKLREAVLQHEQELYDALHTDLKKSPEESWATEIGFFMAEVNNALKQLKAWMKPEGVGTTLINFPSSSYIINEPLGVVLIIAPWNYPVNLLFTPLVGAIAAGNSVVMKPSEFAPATAAVMKKIIEQIFPPQYILYVEGDGATVIPAMMNAFTFDHVFYTGSTSVGKIIYQLASQHLVPVTLELGGKSPCIVESDADIKAAARRIALAKFSNAGQTCVAPDYIMVHSTIKDKLVSELKRTITQFYTENPLASYDYAKVINARQFNRLLRYLNEGNILYGGDYNADRLYIAPTLMDNVPLHAALMTDEIFGPILPIISYTEKIEVLRIINANKNPLAFYVFTQSSSNEKFWLNNVAFGGGCVNNASWHLANHHLPFGGRGFSGTGNYHGRFSFNTFSHKKAVMKTPTWFDPDLKYPPFKGKLRLFKWVIR